MQNLYIAVAIVLVWGGSLLFAQHVVAPNRDQARLYTKTQGGPGRTESRPVPEKSSSRGSPAYEFSFPVRMVESSDEEKRRAEKERRSEQREEDDLNAQRGMAESARDAVFTAWWQVGISLMGAVLLAVSLIYSARAASASALAAKTAEDVLKADRAWMTPVKVNWLCLVSDSNPNQIEGVSFYSIWTNSGRSPAIQVGMWCALKVLPLDEAIPIFNKTYVDENAIVGPGTNINAAKRNIHANDFIGLIEKRYACYLYSVCSYKDTFSAANRLSEHCVRIIFTGFMDTPDGRPAPHFEMFNVGNQNSAN